MFVQKIFNKLVGVFSVVGSWTVDNLKLDGNTLSSTTGDINITPEGTSNVVISKGDINSGTIDATSIGATTASTGKFTTISASGQITSTVASGTAPLVITSPTVVTNLNADLLDGNEASVFATATSLNNVLNGTTDFTKLDVDNLVLDSNTISSVSGKIILAPLSGQDLELTPAGVGNVNITANDLEMAGVVRISSAGLATLLTGSTVGNLTLANGSITDSSGAISFGDENLSTTGTISTGGMRINATALISTGTNQDVNITPNGVGNANITTGALEMAGVERISSAGAGTFTSMKGQAQYYFNGTAYTTATVAIPLNEGYVILNDVSNDIVATLPSIGTADIGKRLRIRNWTAGAYTTTVVRNDSDTIESMNDTTSGTTLTFAAGTAGTWVELAVDWSTQWKIVGMSTGVTLS